MAYDPRLAIAVAAFNLAMYLGFRSGTRGSTHRNSDSRVFSADDLDRLLSLFCIIALLTLFPRLIIATQNYNLDPSTFVSKVSTGFNEAQSIYSERYATRPPGIWQFINYGLVVSGFMAWLYPGLAILFWHRIGWMRRGVAIASFAGSILASIARGQNFGAFDAAIQVVTFFLIKTAVSSREHGRHRYGILRASILLAIGITATSAFFANTMRSRIGDQYDSLIYLGGHWVPIKQSGVMWSITPEALHPLLAGLCSYITHGYAALDMALGLPFDTTYGFGSSYFLMDNGEALLHTDLFPLTYQYKLGVTEAYDPKVLWHTAYLWIANDVSILGVPVVLFALFFIFGRAWRDFLLSGNIFSVLLMAPMANFVSFISANNQLTGQPNPMFAFAVFFVAWFTSSGRLTWDPELLQPSKTTRRAASR